MTDEAKPPKKPASRPRRPRKPATEGAKSPRKPAAKAKQPAETAGRGSHPHPIPKARRLPPRTRPRRRSSARTRPPRRSSPPPTRRPRYSRPTRPRHRSWPPARARRRLPARRSPPSRAHSTASGGGDRRTTLWLVLAVAAVAVVAARSRLGLRPARQRRAVRRQLGAGRAARGGGLVVTSRDDDFEVAMYDRRPRADWAPIRRRTTATRSPSASPTPRRSSGRSKATLTYDEERDVLVLRLLRRWARRARPGVRARRRPRGRAPDPDAHAHADGQRDADAEPHGFADRLAVPDARPPRGPNTAQYDQQVVDAIVAIQVGVLELVDRANGDVFPAAEEVDRRTAASASTSSPWPTNPFTGQPMVVGRPDRATTRTSS